jgi:hypothetical protein
MAPPAFCQAATRGIEGLVVPLGFEQIGDALPCNPAVAGKHGRGTSQIGEQSVTRFDDVTVRWRWLPLVVGFIVPHTISADVLVAGA